MIHWARSIRLLTVATLAALAVLPAALAAKDRVGDPAGATDQRPLYRIGVGDRLDVFVFEDNQRTECVVRPDGRITMPLAGDIEAEGVTPTDLAAKIKKALEPFQKDPTVTVSVREINSYRVYLLGNVRNQQMVASISPLRLLQAIAMAGGLNDFANKNIIILRERKGAPSLRIPVNYTKIVKGEALDLNIWLESGDVVVAE